MGINLRHLSKYLIQAIHVACAIALVAIAVGAAPVPENYFSTASLTSNSASTASLHEDKITPKGGLR